MFLTPDEHIFQGIGQVLVQENLLEKTKAIEYSKLAKAQQDSLLYYLVKNNILSSNLIVSRLSERFGLPIFDLDCFNTDLILKDLIHEQLIQKYKVLPLFKRRGIIILATDDPTQEKVFKEIQFHTGSEQSFILVQTDKLYAIINCLCNNNRRNLTNHNSDLEGVDEAPVVDYINKILQDAVREAISDIHFEPYDQSYRIRYRQDGLLKEVANPPLSLSSRMAPRLKIMGNLDISEKRFPQDGRFKLKYSENQGIDFRISTCPTIAGEKIVVRILDSNSAKLNIDKLGFNLIQQQTFMQAIQRSQGMVLVTGPTGSGKTMTLYSALNSLNKLEVNISTVEDPVEIRMQGINQVAINPKVGLTFATSLRALLRQDPDIIMLGEIRDFETADIAIKAAQTGHLVLSTLHTNSATDALNRLVHMGVANFNLISSISLIIAQRLVRILCDYCKILRTDITKQQFIAWGMSFENNQCKLYKAMGCTKCNQGYKGRIGIFEVLPMTKNIGQLILSGGTSLDLLRQAQLEGMQTIFQSGLAAVAMGITTLEEVNRVTID
ncbi:MAG: Flp pilus assembly complex ATPase component TadA [Legionella sp.]|nr:Flp pilus assembly complex ATPase component TadA [Legionella sp.]